MKRIAIIDLGTNTFQLLIAETGGQAFAILHDSSQPARIGEGGISRGIISPEGIERAIAVLRSFREITDQYQIGPDDILALGTSAVRNAANREEFCRRIENETKIPVVIVPGEEEAGLIFEGVRAGLPLTDKTSLIVDIGGGSVEFILANREKLFWKQSFEIGGQRLMDRFHRTDPILPDSVGKLNEYLEQQLVPLTNAVHQYEPVELIGCAGSFETLVDMEYARTHGNLPDPAQVSFDLSADSFAQSYEQVLTSTLDERLQIPGMKSYRAGMIVVGTCLIAFLLRKYGLSKMRVSTWAMKEGMLARMAR
jgi:exopolyphosphatase/guanosine-5'-triphosphate,3'-diphosphate pyrophosphatase